MCILMCYGGPDTWVGFFVGFFKKTFRGRGGGGGRGRVFICQFIYTNENGVTQPCGTFRPVRGGGEQWKGPHLDLYMLR